MNRKVIGLTLILLGILIFVSLMILDTIHDWRLWSTNNSGKSDEFPTFLEYWWNFNKGTSILALALGVIPFCVGIQLRRHLPQG